MQAGLVGAACCLAATITLALVVWNSSGGQIGQHITSTRVYVLFASTTVGVAGAANVAGYVAWTSRAAAGTLALTAALVTTMTVAVLRLVPTAIAMCLPADAALCVCRYWRPLSNLPLEVPNMLAVPRTLVAACLAVAFTLTVRHLVYRFQEIPRERVPGSAGAGAAQQPD